MNLILVSRWEYDDEKPEQFQKVTNISQFGVCEYVLLPLQLR